VYERVGDLAYVELRLLQSFDAEMRELLVDRLFDSSPGSYRHRAFQGAWARCLPVLDVVARPDVVGISGLGRTTILSDPLLRGLGRLESVQFVGGLVGGVAEHLDDPSKDRRRTVMREGSQAASALTGAVVGPHSVGAATAPNGSSSAGRC
jgi:hypothetical protein